VFDQDYLEDAFDRAEPYELDVADLATRARLASASKIAIGKAADYSSGVLFNCSGRVNETGRGAARLESGPALRMISLKPNRSISSPETTSSPASPRARDVAGEMSP
jgi:hypothetical protein